MPRNILLLQGPVGPFFRKFASQLEGQGHKVVKINLNGGDRHYYRTGTFLNFRGTLSDWSMWVEKEMVRYSIDRIYLFGDCRQYHRQAIAVARRLGIEIYVFEEGYVRPNYITLEKDGVNGYSSACQKDHLINKLVDFEKANPAANETSIAAPVKNVFVSAGCSAMMYYMASSLARKQFPAYRHHRPLNTFGEGSILIKNGLRRYLYQWTERAMSKRLLKGSEPFFLVPLQVHNDTQVTRHSDFGSVEEFIERVVISFSKASTDCLLVFKHHPYDRGYRNYRELIEQLAATHGISKRVCYVHDTDLPTLLQNALGTVMINSTVGLSSLYHQTPVKVMGRAIYDVTGLTYQGTLESFWESPGRVDKKLFNRFRHYLVETTQVNGSVYTGIEGFEDRSGLNWSPAMFNEHVSGIHSPVIEGDLPRVAGVAIADEPDVALNKVGRVAV